MKTHHRVVSKRVQRQMDDVRTASAKRARDKMLAEREWGKIEVPPLNWKPRTK